MLALQDEGQTSSYANANLFQADAKLKKYDNILKHFKLDHRTILFVHVKRIHTNNTYSIYTGCPKKGTPV